MSSSATDPTSMTASSSNSPSRGDGSDPVGDGPDLVALIACGAIAQPAAQAVSQWGLRVDVYPLPPLLHNQPRAIPGEVEALVVRLRHRYRRVLVGYADCGTYGALDEVCARLEVPRLAGLHCYDLYAGSSRIEGLLADQPGTYLLTDFLVKSFSRSVIQELGLDRHPELRDDYFRHYTRMVWLVQTDDPDEEAELRLLAHAAAARIGLPLEEIRTGLSGLERELLRLVGR